MHLSLTLAAISVRLRQIAGALVLSSAVLFLSACGGPNPPISAETAAAPPRTTLSAGDVVKLSFAGAAELNQTQKIRADGRLSLPQIGEVHAAGKTIPQLRQELIALYRPQLTNADVVVTLESGTTIVYIQGQVGRPGRLSFDRPTTILQAITEAGGFNQFANPRRVQIIRMVQGQQRSEVLDLRPTLAGKPTRPFYVRDGDVISVPQSAF